MKSNPYNNKLFESDEKQHEQLKAEEKLINISSVDEEDFYETAKSYFLSKNMYTKEYMPKGCEKISQYPNTEFDSSTQTRIHFRYIFPDTITKEQYEEILELKQKQCEQIKNKKLEFNNNYYEKIKREINENYEKIYGKNGLKIYAPEGDVDINEYPELEWDRENKKYRRFKYANSSKPKQNTRSTPSQTNEPERDRIVVFLMIIAWVIFIGGFIAGIELGKETKIIESRFGSKTETEEVFSFAKALIYWFASLVSGAVFLALSAIIDRLNKIKESLKSN